MKTNPEKGKKRFNVVLKKLVSYTSIGADNIHHACNKATKLWGPNWDFISENEPVTPIWKFVDVKEFGKRIKTVSKLSRRNTNS